MARKSEFDAVFLDVDGTLISGRQALPGAFEMLELFRRDNIPFMFITNDANHSPEEKAAIVNRSGLKIEGRSIISAGSVLTEWARKNNGVGKKFYLMGGLGNPCFAKNAGMETTTNASELDECAGVIVGENNYDWQFVFSDVFNFFLRHPECQLISPNPDVCWAGGRNGGLGIGAGAVAEAMCLWLKHQNVHLKPIYLGKPYPAIFEYALNKMNLNNPERVIMIGDSLSSDVTGANSSGIKSGLVLTGITSRKQAENSSGMAVPDFIFSVLK